MRRTTVLSLIFGALLAGLILARFGVTLPVGPAMVFGFLLLVAALKYRRWLGLAFIIIALMLGVWRGQQYAASQRLITDHIGEKVVVTGVVADDPGYDPRGFMEFRLGDVNLNGQPVPGELKVRLYQINLHRGYRVEANGKLKDGFGNVPAELSYPQLTVASMQQSGLEQVRQRFFVGMKTALSEPMASFGLGLLVGIRSLIPKDLQDQLALVGLSHLVAVSGYNLTIIVVAAHRLLERFGRGIALAASLWLMGVFLVVTGASASIVRASVVAVLALLATYYGRRFQPVALILVSAGLTAAYKPLYLTDLGWLLSFLAFFGIMILAPALEARVGHPKNILLKLLIETSAAQVMTIPLILYFFGDLSIVAPLTNVIELPLVPLAMLLSLIAGVSGMIMPAFAGWIAWPASLLLHFMLAFVDLCARLPWAGTTVRITLPAMFGMYGLILLITLVLRRGNQRHGRTESTQRLLEITGSAKMPGEST